MTESVGSAATEAVLLVETLLGGVREWMYGEHPAHLATGSRECEVCPVCLLLSKVRELPPETFDQMSGAVMTFLAGVATHFEGTAHPEETPATPGTDGR